MDMQAILKLWQDEAQSGELVLSRYRMRFFTWGNGPALFFIPGLGDTPKSFLPVMSQLKDRFKCIGYYLPQGENDQAKLRGYQHRFLSYDWENLADHLAVKDAMLLGHSFGATIALDAMHRFPDRITRGILLNGFAERPLKWKEWFFAHLASWFGGKRTYGSLRKVEKLEVAKQKRDWAMQNPALWQHFLEETGQSLVKAMGYWALQLNQLDQEQILSEIKQQILLIHGENDAIVPTGNAETLSKALVQSQSITLSGAGHVVMYSHPQQVVEAIVRFLEPMKEIHQRSFGPLGTEMAASPV